MDRHSYFIFSRRIMVVLGLFQIACATLCVICGLIDGAYRGNSTLSKSRIPIWAGAFMSIPGIMALFSSQKKNPIVMHVTIIASVFCCFNILAVIIYASVTLEYGEKYEGSNNHPAIVFMLGKFVEGANIIMLISSTFSVFIVLMIAYISCQRLPCCSCYDSITRLERLKSNEDQSQTTELVCISLDQADRILNSPVKLPHLNMETDNEINESLPYIQLT